LTGVREKRLFVRWLILDHVPGGLDFASARAIPADKANTTKMAQAQRLRCMESEGTLGLSVMK
jgi:hypothetical protein